MDSVLSVVNTTIHPKDEMLLDAVQRLQSQDLARSLYFRQGDEIHDTIKQIANWRFGDLARVPKFLEFACGYGRSTRFLARDLNPSKIWVSDIYKEAVEFQKRTFNVNGFVSVTDPSILECSTRFDMIFVASLFTHLPAARFEAWFKSLFEMLSPKGILAFSVHDEALAAGRSIPPSGILFVPESESQSLSKAEYGTNVVTESYVSSVIRMVAGSTWKYHRGRRVLCCAQDVYLVSRDPKEDFSGFQYRLLPVGCVDLFLRKSDGTINIEGWAGEPNEGLDLDGVRVYFDGQLLASSKIGRPRPDVANVLGQPKFAQSGFEVMLPKSDVPKSGGMIEVRAFSETGASTMLHFSPLSAAQKAKEAVIERSFFELAEDKSSVADACEFVPAGHFYSAIPSREDREAYLNSDLENKPLQGIRLNDKGQCEIFNQLTQYYSECPFPGNKTDKYRYYYENQSYSYTDGLILYSMIRHFKPARIIEVGSGFSSCVMMDTSDHFHNGAIVLNFIEPYPELLQSLMKTNDKKHVLLPIRLQDVDLNLFLALEENDILFIDSTHVSKLNSDVNWIIFELLPSLKKGVLIHFHDIFWPFEYPKEWIREGKAWNEAYLLRAFLEFNESYEIVFFASYMHTYHGEMFQKQMPLCLKNTGGNIWIRKIK